MTANTDELFCVLLALDGERLLLPRQALVEAMAWAELLPMPGAPAWYPGTLNWNGQSVPVVSFEAMLGRDVTMLTGRTRIALLRTVGDRIPGRLLGVVVQGFPQTLRVTRESLKPDEAASPPERGPVLCRVRMVNESALIPDLESLEEMVADETVSR
jgi:chemosensory pili system protein ChpC